MLPGKTTSIVDDRESPEENHPTPLGVLNISSTSDGGTSDSIIRLVEALRLADRREGRAHDGDVEDDGELSKFFPYQGSLHSEATLGDINRTQVGAEQPAAGVRGTEHGEMQRKFTVLDLGAGNSALLRSIQVGENVWTYVFHTRWQIPYFWSCPHFICSHCLHRLTTVFVQRDLPGAVTSFAVDYSPKAFECLRELAGPGPASHAEAIVADARFALPFRPGLIDLVVDKGCIDAVGWRMEVKSMRDKGHSFWQTDIC